MISEISSAALNEMNTFMRRPVRYASTGTASPDMSDKLW